MGIFSQQGYRVQVSKYVDQNGFAAVLAIKTSAGVASQVNLKNPLHIGNGHASNGIQPGFETQVRRHQKSMTGISVAPQKGPLSSQKLF